MPKKRSTACDAFEGLAEEYDRYRPSYPETILQALARFALPLGNATLPEMPMALDVGSGTGILTRLLRTRLPKTFTVVGLDPGEDMGRVADMRTPSTLDINYEVGRAENLPYGDASITVVASGQALHWFDRPAFYGEARRVLHRGAALALLENNRIWSESPFLDAYENWLESNHTDYVRDYRAIDVVQEVSQLDGFEEPRRISEQWIRSLNSDQYIGLCLTSSRVNEVVERRGRSAVVQDLHSLTDTYFVNGPIEIPYQTQLVLARRR